jgi:hypothetical protein
MALDNHRPPPNASTNPQAQYLPPGRQDDKIPIIDDKRARVSTLSIDVDLGQAAIESAWLLLKPMIEARQGYWKASTVRDCQLVVPTTCEMMALRLMQDMGFRTPLLVVPCEMLKTNFTWELRFGLDAVLSIPGD